jgi:hypothetical protein
MWYKVEISVFFFLKKKIWLVISYWYDIKKVKKKKLKCFEVDFFGRNKKNIYIYIKEREREREREGRGGGLPNGLIILVY